MWLRKLQNKINIPIVVIVAHLCSQCQLIPLVQQLVDSDLNLVRGVVLVLDQGNTLGVKGIQSANMA